MSASRRNGRCARAPVPASTPRRRVRCRCSPRPARASTGGGPALGVRQSLDGEPESPKPGCGWLPPAWMPVAALRRAARGLAGPRIPCSPITAPRADRSVPLRRLLSRQCAAEGLAGRPDQVLLTGSGTQAIDLICRLLVRPGDNGAGRRPLLLSTSRRCCAPTGQRGRHPLHRGGTGPGAFRASRRAHRPRLYVTIRRSTTRPAHALAGLRPPAPQRGRRPRRHIVEDDIFAPFEPEPSPPQLAALDGSRG